MHAVPPAGAGNSLRPPAPELTPASTRSAQSNTKHAKSHHLHRQLGKGHVLTGRVPQLLTQPAPPAPGLQAALPAAAVRAACGVCGSTVGPCLILLLKRCAAFLQDRRMPWGWAAKDLKLYSTQA